MSGSKFVYVIIIRTTAEKCWDALTKPEFTKAYWSGTSQHSAWTKGAPWEIRTPDGRTWDTGEIIEIDRPRKIVLTWRNEHFPEMKAEGHTTLTYELVETAGEVRLTLTHEIDLPNSKVIGAVSGGWPSVLSSLKTLLETGEPLASTREWPKGL
jgi:uncharacterized protein YndB with AHSA1/START domain